MSHLSRECDRFRRLTNESRDRLLEPSEEALLTRHSGRCESCARWRDQSHLALSLLADDWDSPELRPNFSTRLLRRVRMDRTRGGWAYWSPAVLGLMIGISLVTAALQMMRSHGQPTVGKPFGEARREPESLPVFPELRDTRTP